jgi:alpha,alpha-trehalase
MAWWDTNRSISVTSPYTNVTHNVFHYNVFVNTAPRPEGYLEDYKTVMEASPALNKTAQEKLYQELATGAESGYDYAARWMKVPVINVSDNNPTLRTLNCIAQIPVDLNSLMAGNHAIVSFRCWPC